MCAASEFDTQIEPLGDGLVQHWSGGRNVQLRDIPTFYALQLRQPVDFRDRDGNNL